MKDLKTNYRIDDGDYLSTQAIRHLLNFMLIIKWHGKIC